jgi:hypothetical protein
LCSEVAPQEEKLVVMIGTGPLEDYVYVNGVAAIDRIAASAVQLPTLVESSRYIRLRDPQLQRRLRAFLAEHGTGPGED